MTTLTAMAVRPRAGERDAELCERLVAGDERARVEVYAEHAEFVHGLARRVTASATLAEDVTQEVFVTLWERPHAFDPRRGTMRSWLGVLTHRRSVDRVRREATARRYEDRRATAFPAPPPADVADEATTALRAEDVRRAVAALPEDQRRAVELAYFAGMTYVEVAEALGIPEGTAKSRLRLAMKRLAVALGPDRTSEWT